MKDNDIRSALCCWLNRADPHAAIIEEMPLCRGVGRADVAAVNGAMNGYEIKSDHDSFARLPKQIENYQSIFDYCHLVVGEKHVSKVESLLPDGWGLVLVKTEHDEVSVRRLRKARRNTYANTDALVRLLWKPEAVRVLRQLGSPIKANAPVMQLWHELQQAPRRRLLDLIREQLKIRAMPATVQRFSQCDDSFPTEATAVDCRGRQSCSHNHE